MSVVVFVQPVLLDTGGILPDPILLMDDIVIYYVEVRCLFQIMQFLLGIVLFNCSCLCSLC